MKGRKTICFKLIIYPIWLLCLLSEMEVFGENHPFPFSKMLTFYRKEPFTLEATYAYPNHVPYSKTFVGNECFTLILLDAIEIAQISGHFLIDNVVAAPNGENSKVKVKVRLNGHGLFAVTSASLYESQQKTDDEQMVPETNDEQPMETAPADQDGAKPAPTNEVVLSLYSYMRMGGEGGLSPSLGYLQKNVTGQRFLED